MTKQDILDLCEERNWDAKEWHRATGLDQRVLENIMNIELDEDNIDLIYKLTKNGKDSKLLRFPMPKVIAVGIHKGGAGKTTMTVNIAYELAKLGYNVLVIDTDSQMDSTKVLMNKELEQSMYQYNFYECITRRTSFMSAIMSTKYTGLDLVPADAKLSNIESMLSTMSFKENVFKDCMTELNKENYYDFVIVDMDKNIGQLNTSVFVAADYLLMVSECSSFCIEGMVTLKQQYDLVKQNANPNLDILGIILNKVNARKEVVKIAKPIINEYFPDKCFQNHVRNDSVVEKSQWNKESVSEFQRSSDASRQIRNITYEILERIAERK